MRSTGAETVLAYKRHGYGWLALAVAAASILAYLVDSPPRGPSGGTPLGYGLGGVSTGLVLWLAAYGWRKRAYGGDETTLEGWLSAHVYLGVSVLVVATLHAAFQVGWNVHTLAYGLLAVVVVSGIVGIRAYVRLPARLADNRGGMTLEELMRQIADLDVECRETAAALPDPVNQVIVAAAEGTTVGGGLFRQVSGRDSRCSTAAALARIQDIARGATGDDVEPFNRLIALLIRKNELLGRARRDVQLRAFLEVWRFVHVPATAALLAALVGHVVAVFYYW